MRFRNNWKRRKRWGPMTTANVQPIPNAHPWLYSFARASFTCQPDTSDAEGETLGHRSDPTGRGGHMPPQGTFAHVNQTPVMREASPSTTGPTHRAEAGTKPSQGTFTPLTQTPLMRQANLSTTGPTQRAEAGTMPPQGPFANVNQTPAMREASPSTTGPTHRAEAAQCRRKGHCNHLFAISSTVRALPTALQTEPLRGCGRTSPSDPRPHQPSPRWVGSCGRGYDAYAP